MTAPAPVEAPRDRPRSRWAALAVVVLLAVVAVAYGVHRSGAAGSTPGDGAATAVSAGESTDPAELAALRRRADLAPCPAGLGPDLPDLTLPCLSGGPAVRLQAAAPGRPTLVNVWGSWCTPCTDEVPTLAAFAARAGDAVGLVGVLTSDTERSALTFAASTGMRWPSVVDDDGRVLRANRPGPPVTLFLNASGRVVFRKSGAFRSEAEVEQLVAEHLGVRL